MVLITRSLLALVAVFSLGATATHTVPVEIDSRGLGSLAKGPLALLGGPEGLAISLILDTKPGQEAEAYLEKEAEKAAQPVTDYLESEAKKHAKSELDYFTSLTQQFKSGKGPSAKRSLLKGIAKGPLALLGGPEGIAISLLLDTKPGQEAEAYLEKEAEKAAQPVTDYLKSEAKKHAKSELQYFTEITQKFGGSKTRRATPAERRSLLKGIAKGPLALLGGPEGIAISLLLDTKPGQEAEAYLEKEAEKAAQPVTDYLKSEAKKHGKSELQYFTEISQKFH